MILSVLMIFHLHISVEFIRENTFTIFETLCLCLKCEVGFEIGKMIPVQSGDYREFDNSNFYSLWTTEGITHEFPAPITPL